MTLVFEERPSDSPYVESITYGRTVGSSTTIRPAEIHWHMVIARYQGGIQPILTGPLTRSGVVSFMEGIDLLWIKFRLGAFIPHLPPRNLLNAETTLPEAASANSFWLKGSAWQLPTYENADTFVNRLIRQGVLDFDPVVRAALQDKLPEMPLRTVRHRFQRATGLTYTHIRQHERAQRAAALLRQGASILDTVYDAGYFDQPHLTRSLKQYVGYTPAQLVNEYARSCQNTSHTALSPHDPFTDLILSR